MRISHLEHCAIRTVRLEECIKFYRDILGFVEGPRPPFSVRGVWFYSGLQPLVHITYIDNAPSGSDEKSAARSGGYLDHVAFRATGLASMIARLERERIPFDEVVIPSFQVYQLFIRDPDGVVIELDFSTDEVVTARSPRIVA